MHFKSNIFLWRKFILVVPQELHSHYAMGNGSVPFCVNKFLLIMHVNALWATHLLWDDRPWTVQLRSYSLLRICKVLQKASTVARKIFWRKKSGLDTDKTCLIRKHSWGIFELTWWYAFHLITAQTQLNWSLVLRKHVASGCSQNVTLRELP